MMSTFLETNVAPSRGIAKVAAVGGGNILTGMLIASLTLAVLVLAMAIAQTPDADALPAMILMGP